MSKPQDAQHVPVSDVDRLRQDARAAAEVRALQTHPDVVALRVERVRSQVDGLMWAGLLLGLAFTMVNVQTFAAAGAAVGSLAWCAAWLLDPMVSLVLIAVLRAEQVTARWQVDMRTVTSGPWVKRTKVFAFAATYTMNTWASWAELHVSGIVLHSVPPAMVYLAAETGPILRDRLTEAVLKAARTVQPDTTSVASAGVPDAGGAGAGGAGAVTEPAGGGTAGRTRPAPRQRAASRPGKAKRGRKLLADYVDDARASWSPGVEITAAWARRASGCSAGLSPKVAAALREQIAATHPAALTPTTTPTTTPTVDAAADVSGREAA